MVNTQLLEKKMDESGYKINHIVEKVGISKQAFRKKVKGINQFRVAEIYVLRHLLNLSDYEEQEIFFADKVDL